MDIDRTSDRERGYDLVARRLVELCPLRAQGDVVAYLDERGILADAEAAGVVALPAMSAQPSIVRILLDDFGREVLEAAGVLRENAPSIDWANHRVIIPWRHRSGRITALQRRTLEPRKPKYVFPRSGGHPTAPFGAQDFDPALVGPVIVCEGALDTLARRKLARRWGEACQVVGAPSVSTLFTPATWRPFVEGRDVLLAFDSDDAGARAASVFAKEMCAGARSVLRERLEGAKDFGEVVLREVTR